MTVVNENMKNFSRSLKKENLIIADFNSKRYRKNEAMHYAFSITLENSNNMYTIKD